MDPSAKFWDKTAEGYAVRPIANEAVYDKKLKKTREYFEPDMEVWSLAAVRDQLPLLMLRS